MKDGFGYEQPRKVEDVAECFFYHVMDLPGIGLVGEQWDLRETTDQYLGDFDYKGKRALDVGAGSGFLTFEMEKRGAEVVSFDLGDDIPWDIVPSAASGTRLEDAIAQKRDNVERLKNSYWYAHRLLKSNARAFYGNIYDLPLALGTFDVIFLGAVLLHLRDPFQALYSVSRLSADAIVISDISYRADEPVMSFLPTGTTGGAIDTWWQLSEPCIIRMLETIGFRTVSVSRSKHLAVHGGTHRAIEF